MGLDHPLVQEELGRWRSVPPEEVGIAVSGDVDEPILLSLWIVEASAGKGERRVVVQPICRQAGRHAYSGGRAPVRKIPAKHRQPRRSSKQNSGLIYSPEQLSRPCSVS